MPYRSAGHGPKSGPRDQDSTLLVDATLKGTAPPLALPTREFMERAKAIWEELGLPKLRPESPWFGYSLGEWSSDLDEAATRATRCDSFETGQLLEKRRRKDVRMNTEARNVDESKRRPRKPKR